MQPVLLISAPVAGILYVNGRFVGEIESEKPMVLPVTAWGALYLEFRALEAGWQDLARRLTLSGGTVMSQGLARDLFVIAWPGGVTEVEMSPQRASVAERRQMNYEQGITYALCEGAETYLEVEKVRCVLPEGAKIPQMIRWGNALLFMGEARADGRYLAVVSSDGTRLLGLLQAQQIELDGNMIRAITRQTDVVGHAKLETWRLDGDALVLEGGEPAWAHGAPRWPGSAQDAALAALQATFLGLDAEADGYLVPNLAGKGLVRSKVEGFDGCAELKFAMPDARNAVGLLKTESPNCARVTPLYYAASPMGGMQGAWRISSLEFS